MSTGLRKIVDDASTGPWRADSNDSVYSDHHKPCWVVCDVLDGDESDARFIATFDPVLVSALLDVAEAAGSLMEAVVPVGHPRFFELRSALDRLEEVRSD